MLFTKHMFSDTSKRLISDLYKCNIKTALDIITIKMMYDYNLKFRFKTLNLLLDVSKISFLVESNQTNNALAYSINRYVVETQEFGSIFGYTKLNRSISGIMQVLNKANLAHRSNTHIISIKLPRVVIKVVEDYINTNKTFTLNTAIWLILYKNLIA